MLKRLLLAIPEAVEHWRAYVDFETSLHSERKEDIAAWEVMLTAWEEDHKNPCPYDTKAPGQCIIFRDNYWH